MKSFYWRRAPLLRSLWRCRPARPTCACRSRQRPCTSPLARNSGGWFVGAHVGWANYDRGWNDKDSWAGFVDDEFSRDYRTDKSGFAGGVGVGYNWQPNCALFGIELDYSWASINANKFITDGGINDTLDISSRLQGFGTLRARTGVVVDNVLIYVTGGLAWANFNRSWTLFDEEECNCAQTLTA